MIDDHSNAPQTPLRLTSTQSAILSLLKERETERYPLSNWYLGALYAVANTHNPDRFSQAAQSIRELLEKLPRVTENAEVQVNLPNFKQLKMNIHARFQVDKKKYEDSWKGKKIDSHLGVTLMKIDDYLESYQQPTRKEQSQKAMESADPLSRRLDANTRERKRERFHRLWKDFENIVHHQYSSDEEKFNQYMGEFESIILDILSQKTAQNQLEIQSILNQQHQTGDDVERLFSLVDRTGANYTFFFNQVSTPSLLGELNQRGYFSNSPDNLAPINYLFRIVDQDTKGVVDTILKMENIDNPLILNRIAKIAFKATSIEQSLRLKKHMIEYMDSAYPDSHINQLDTIPKLIERWFGKSSNATKAALELVEKVVSFQPDPEMDEKISRREKNPNDWTVIFNHAPRFESWDYQKVLKENICPLARKIPWELANILINAVVEMYRLHEHSKNTDRESREHYFENWCPRLGKSIWTSPSPKQDLINALTYTCETLYKSAPEHIDKLNEKLTEQPWPLFKRIRQHLYAHNLNEQTKPRVREMVLSHPDYAEWKYHYEFQQMLRCACEHFGENFLTKKERTKIFDAILSGPSKDTYRTRFGDKFTEDAFRQLQQKFHRMQLRPFSAVLFGKYLSYFKELEAEPNEPISDEDYSPPPKVTSGMTYRSPKSSEHLANLLDEELLAYINEWQGQHDIELDWMMEESIKALSGAFCKVFMETIIPDENRLNFWLKNRDRIQRPVYAQVMVDAMQENVKAKKFVHIDRWLDFCQWVLSRPDSHFTKTFPFGEESREAPGWTTSRRSVVDFINACFSECVDAPISARPALANLLRSLCTQPDWTLDQEKHDHDDLVNSAVNRTRGIALENVVYFGIWVRRHDPDSAVPEIATILNARFGQNDTLPITLPEYAILGSRYFQITILNPAWAQEHKADIFPHENFSAWRAAFSAVIRYFRDAIKDDARIGEQLYHHLEDEYRFAVEHLDELLPTHQEREYRRTEIINRFGHHLFVYYLWGMFSIDDGENFLGLFYEKTREHPKHWRNLFDYAGRLLKLEGATWGDDMVDKSIKFFDWRFAERNPEELQEFFHWWVGAECLPAKWRLDNFLQILNLCQPETTSFMRGVPALAEMLKEQPEKVVECFAKITDFLPADDYIYIDAKTKEILKFGINSDDQNTRQHAKHAQEKLLRHGYSDFLQLDD